MSDGKKKLHLPPLSKNGYLQMTFRIKTEDGKVLPALSIYCSKVEYNDFMQEASFE